MTGRGRTRAAVTVPLTHGRAEIAPDPRRPAGWTVRVDGVEQSYVDLDEPTYLKFEYARHLAAVIDAIAPSGGALRVLHLGGGGLTLPRYVQATRPGSAQVVIERDPTLAALVQRLLPLPEGTDLRVHLGDARATLGAVAPDPEADPTAGFDLVIADVYQAAQMPIDLTTTGFAREVAAVLRPGGLYAVNVADLPTLTLSRVQAATLRHSFTETCLIASSTLLRGRRYGNVVLVATDTPGGLPLTRLRPRDPQPVRVLQGEDLGRFIAGARPMHDPPRFGHDPRHR